MPGAAQIVAEPDDLAVLDGDVANLSAIRLAYSTISANSAYVGGHK
jgi:hypothetical protein